MSSVINMDSMFKYSSFNSDISKWEVSSVADMGGMFYGSAFNSNISEWDVSSVIDMSSMFNENKVFNGDISKWDVSSVANMVYMFRESVFNGDLSNWNVSSVSAMGSMFRSSIFNGDLSNWDVSSDTLLMDRMFYDNEAFNQDLCAWGDKFPYVNADGNIASDIFAESGCTFQDTPHLDKRGPFCACDRVTQCAPQPTPVSYCYVHIMF